MVADGDMAVFFADAADVGLSLWLAEFMWWLLKAQMPISITAAKLVDITSIQINPTRCAPRASVTSIHWCSRWMFEVVLGDFAISQTFRSVPPEAQALRKRPHQPEGLIVPATTLQAFGACQLAQSSQRAAPLGDG